MSKGTNGTGVAAARPGRSQRPMYTLAVAAAAWMLVTATVASAGVWHIQSTGSPGTADNTFYEVSMASASDGWAVGYQASTGSSEKSLAERFNGTGWTVVSTPSPGVNGTALLSVRTTSTTNAWAVGYTLDSGSVLHPLILHFNGTSWAVQSNPGFTGSLLNAIGASSKNNAWAVGGSSGPMAEHWNGTSWSLSTLPPPPSIPTSLEGVSVRTASDVWAVGASYSSCGPNRCSKTFILHWDGSHWTIQTTPSPGSQVNELFGISAHSATDAWAVGRQSNDGTTYKTLLLHFDGVSWQKVIVPHPGITSELRDIKVLSTTDIWAVGTTQPDSSHPERTLTLQYDGSQWKRVGSPNAGGTSVPNELDGIGGSLTTGVFAVGTTFSFPTAPLAIETSG